MVNKWEIYYADLNPGMGSEQTGVRPVLIVSNNATNKYLSVCTVVPLSSFKNNDTMYPSEIYLDKENTGLDKNSILMFQQIRTIDISRIKGAPVGAILREDIRDAINIGVMHYFDIF